MERTPSDKSSSSTCSDKSKPKHIQCVGGKSPNCVLISIGGDKVNALLDSGADISILRSDMFHKIKNSLQLNLQNSKEKLRNASGKFLKVIGETSVQIQVGTQQITQKFQITKDIRVPVILGTDFLEKNNVGVWIAQKTVIVNSERLPLREFSTVSSLVRVVKTCRIPSQESVTLFGKVRPTERDSTVSIVQSKYGFLNKEPGLKVMDTIGKTVQGKYVPFTVINSTGRDYTIPAGCVIGNIQVLGDEDLNGVESNINIKYDDVSKFNLQTEIDISEEEREQFNQLIQKNSDVFATHKYDLGLTDLVQCDIETGDHPPIKKTPYRIPYVYRDQVEGQINEMIKNDIIIESRSEWAFPLVVIGKKNSNECRICIDHRSLNDVTKKYHWPLTQIEDSFNKLSGSRYFSSLDLCQGYHQVKVAPESQEKTAFLCEFGHYQYKRMSFGLCNAPAIFSELMAKVLKGSMNSISYLDDILVFSKSFSQHLTALQDVFNRLRNANLKLKISKCEFLQKELPYLGHIITQQGLIPSPEKVSAIADMPTPKTVRDVRGFIGMCSYYRRYVPGFARIAQPLTQLTKKFAKFEWGSVEEQAFQNLKKALVETPILKIPDFNKEFKLWTDASNKAIGAVLTQAD